MRKIMLKLWLAPKVWLHGSQSTITGGASSRKGQVWAMACWLEHIMRWVLMTPLGSPVEPEVKRILATVSGPTRAKASSTAAVGRAARSSAKAVQSRPSGGFAPMTISAEPKSTARRAPANLAPSAAKTMLGASRAAMAFSLPKSRDMRA